MSTIQRADAPHGAPAPPQTTTTPPVASTALCGLRHKGCWPEPYPSSPSATGSAQLTAPTARVVATISPFKPGATSVALPVFYEAGALQRMLREPHLRHMLQFLLRIGKFDPDADQPFPLIISGASGSSTTTSWPTQGRASIGSPRPSVSVPVVANNPDDLGVAEPRRSEIVSRHGHRAEDNAAENETVRALADAAERTRDRCGAGGRADQRTGPWERRA